MNLGDFIQQYRNEHGMSMRSFAKQSHLSVQHISNIERGLNNDGKPLSPTMETYEKIANACGLDVNELLSKVKGSVRINPEYTDEELLLISLFRKADKESRSAIIEILSKMVGSDNIV